MEEFEVQPDECPDAIIEKARTAQSEKAKPKAEAVDDNQDLLDQLGL